jgi:hypothetical protein
MKIYYKMKKFKLYVGQNSDPNQLTQLLNTNSIATCQELLGQLKKRVHEMTGTTLPVATPSDTNPSGHHGAACHRPTDTTLLRHRPAPVLIPSCYSRWRDANPLRHQRHPTIRRNSLN